MRVTIHTPTPDLDRSVAFYEKLGFVRSSAEHVGGEGSVLLTNGAMLVEVNPERTARAGLRLTKPRWADEADALSRSATVVTLPSSRLAVDPSGVWVYLTEADGAAAEQPPEGPADCLLGNWAGLTLETVSIQESVDFWEPLGFPVPDSVTKPISEHAYLGGVGPGGFGITWIAPNACPHLFFNPSFTFFNSGKNPEIIAAMREAEIEITEEITVFNKDGLVDNVIIRDPGGYGFFVFND